MNAGMVIKRNSNQRYATNGVTGVLIREVCRRASLPPVQEFLVRQDCGCGSTIGPLISTATGIRAIDMGCPQLSMHSIREQMGICDCKFSSSPEVHSTPWKWGAWDHRVLTNCFTFSDQRSWIVQGILQVLQGGRWFCSAVMEWWATNRIQSFCTFVEEALLKYSINGLMKLSTKWYFWKYPISFSTFPV